MSCGEGGGVMRATRHAVQNVGRRTTNRAGSVRIFPERAHTLSPSRELCLARRRRHICFPHHSPAHGRHLVGLSNNFISPAVLTSHDGGKTNKRDRFTTNSHLIKRNKVGFETRPSIDALQFFGKSGQASALYRGSFALVLSTLSLNFGALFVWNSKIR